MTHQRVIFIPAPPPPPPPPTVCTRIKTNQHAQVGLAQEPLTPDEPGIGTWLGAVSGATGIHQAYFYEDLGDDIEQQYIIMATVENGPFEANEDLTGTLL